MRLYNDDLPALLRAQGEALRHNLSYVGLSLVPLLITAVPLDARSSRSCRRGTATPG